MITLVTDSIWLTKVLSAYFPTNEDVGYKNAYQEDMRKITLPVDKINAMIAPINDSFSISFDFTPLEIGGTIFELRNDTSITNMIRVSIDENGKLYVYIAENDSVFLAVVTPSAVQLNKTHHFCLVSGGGCICYNHKVTYPTSVKFAISIFSFFLLTSENKRSVSHIVDIDNIINITSNLDIVNVCFSLIDSNLRTAIYNNDYGYDIILLAG